MYDDAGSVIKNVVVNGMVDWKEAFSRDYWGTQMNEVQSHKSFRPITTITLKLNYVMAKYIQQNQDRRVDDKATNNDNTQDLPPTWTFRVINVALHAIATGLITKATAYVLPSDNVVSEVIVGSLFGLHPVHAEVVSNITSRSEMLMSIFFLLAFLSFAQTRQACHRKQRICDRQSEILSQSLQQNQQQLSPSTSAPYLSPSQTSRLVPWWQRLLGIYIIPWLCMTLSIFSKEQGATTLISLVLWDFLKYHGDLSSLYRKLFPSNPKKTDDDNDATTTIATLKPERAEAWQFVWRTAVLAIETLIIVGWRYMLNGQSSPDFIVAQNPAGFAEDRFTKLFSVTWVYCLYIRDALYPYYLSPDWSGLSIDLITHWKDPRTMVVLALWYFAAQSLSTMLIGSNSNIDGDSANNSINGNITVRQINMAVWAFIFSPFLLSSNILVVVGLMKADRVIYLPLFGFCLLEAILINKFIMSAVKMRLALECRKEQAFWAAHFSLMFQLIIFTARTHEQNLAWSDSLQLWGSAYAINPRSYHTMYNYGYELSLKQRYVEAEEVMRPIGDPRVDGPSNTFVYTMVLFNLRQCDKANVLLDKAFEVIAEKRLEGGPRNSDSHLARTESNLLVSKAHCTQDPKEKGGVLYNAVEMDPTNDYAIQLATNFMEKLQNIEELRSGET